MKRYPKQHTSLKDEKAFVIRTSTRYVIFKALLPLMLTLLIAGVAAIFQIGYLLYIVIIPLGYGLYQTIFYLSVKYEIREGQIKYHRGVFGHQTDFLEIYRIKDFTVRKPFMLRILGAMHIHMATSDKSHPNFRMEGIPVSNIAEVMRDLTERARAKKGVYEID